MQTLKFNNTATTKQTGIHFGKHINNYNCMNTYLLIVLFHILNCVCALLTFTFFHLNVSPTKIKLQENADPLVSTTL